MILIISIYIIGVLSFFLWDSFVGWGVDLDGFYNPPLPLAAGLWFISIPILMMYNFIRLCQHIKDTRVERQKKEKKFRIQEEKRKAVEDAMREKEIEKAFLELEADESLIENIDNLRKKK
jgi:hypothetical protein